MKTVTLTIHPNHVEVLKENQEIVNKWIVGLRSGKYAQANGAMTDPNIVNSACCLMVLEAECNNKSTSDYTYVDSNNTVNSYGLTDDSAKCLQLLRANNASNLLPQALKAELSCGNQVLENSTTPSQWNDTLKLTFNQIADLLESGSINFEYEFGND